MVPRKNGVQFLGKIALIYCVPALLLSLAARIGKGKNDDGSDFCVGEANPQLSFRWTLFFAVECAWRTARCFARGPGCRTGLSAGYVCSDGYPRQLGEDSRGGRCLLL